jgi:transposase-like protein
MEAKTTARQMLKNLLAEIERGPFTVSRVCVKAGMNPSVASRWRAKDIEPRLSTIERLQEAHAQLRAENPELVKQHERELAQL